MWKNERIPVFPLPPYPEEGLEADPVGHQNLADFYNSLGRGELSSVPHSRLLREGEGCFYRSEAIFLRPEAVHQGIDGWSVKPLFAPSGLLLLVRFLLGTPILQSGVRDEGEILITSQRILFYGRSEVVAWNVSEILNARGSDGIIQMFPGGSDSLFFAVPDGILFLKVLEGVLRKSNG